jgi:hypothetical protein
MADYWRFPFLTLVWVVALMSGAFSIFRELYGMYSGTIPPRSLFWSCTWIAFVVAVTILWTIEHTEKLRLRKEIEGKKPRLKMTLESTLTEYDKAKDATVFVLSAYLVNAGEPTIASGWNAKYYVGEGVEKMTGWYVTGTYTIKIGAESLTLTNQ